MNAYLNDPQLKLKLIDELKKHRAADAMLQQTYGGHFPNAVEFRGCAVGCTLHSLGQHSNYGDHGAYETLLGVPRWLAEIQDAIFEGLDSEEAKDWPIQFAEAIPVGADLEPVWYQIGVLLLADPEIGIRQYVDGDDGNLVDQVIELYQRRVQGGIVEHEEILALARALALALARALALALARARDFARVHALVLARDLARDRDRDLTWEVIRDRVLELLRNAPVPSQISSEV